jgi:hypothetical protein
MYRPKLSIVSLHQYSSDLIGVTLLLQISCGCIIPPDCPCSSLTWYGSWPERTFWAEYASVDEYGSLPDCESWVLPSACSPLCFFLYLLKKNAAADSASRKAQPRPVPRPIASALLLFDAGVGVALAAPDFDVGLELAWLVVVVEAVFVDDEEVAEADDAVGEEFDEDVAAPTCPVAAKLDEAIGSVMLKYSDVAIGRADPTATAAS